MYSFFDGLVRFSTLHLATVFSSFEQGMDVGNVFMTTNIAAAVSTVATMVFTWVKYGKPDVSMTLNGSLAGLVAITAGLFSS